VAQGIYRITNLVNDKFYVGSTNNAHTRFQVHRRALRRGKHHCRYLQAAWDKYGEQKFRFEMVELVDDAATLGAVEDGHLQLYAGKSDCYNSALRVVPAGEHHYRFGKTLSEEVRKKIGDAQRGVPKGPQQPEHREKTLQQAAKGRAAIAAAVAAGTLEHMRPVAQQAVFDKFRPAVLEKYDFTAAVYEGALKPITGIKCPEHGVFQQYAAQLRKEGGAECPVCGQEQRVRSQRSSPLRGRGGHEKGEPCHPNTVAALSKPVVATSPTSIEYNYASLTGMCEVLGLQRTSVLRVLKSGQPLTRGPRAGWSFRYAA
jgi:group I intron endonuclease